MRKKKFPLFEKAKQWLDIYFSGKEPDFTVPLHFTGTDFQNEVWEILCTIPYGQTMTYGEIAKQIAVKKGLPRMSAQAVGGAVGHNEISIIVPCHRVVGTNGSLTGYAGGIDKKIKLLTISLTGRLDTATAPQLESELKRSVAGVTELCFDFAGLEYISSAGLRVLLSAQKVMNPPGQHGDKECERRGLGGLRGHRLCGYPDH